MNPTRILTCLALVLAVGLACLAPGPCPASEDSASEKRYALSVYGGGMTDGSWRESLTGQAGFIDSQLVAGAVSWSFFQADSKRWSLELEANVARHTGIQNHWEFNLPVATARWSGFPWSEALDTSLAYGLGPSYATDLPRAEKEVNSGTENLLLFWHGEVTVGLPDRPWALLFRLHHRSTAYGVFGRKGGSNALTTGLRYEF